MMELKAGDKVKTTREIKFVNGEILPKGSILTYECRVDYLNVSFLKDENGVTTVLKDGDFELVKEEKVKVKMIMGENRIVKCGEYRISWKDYKCNCIDVYSFIEIKDSISTPYTLRFNSYNYKQQMEITNMIFDKLGLNVELVEEDSIKVLEKIDKLEAELEKLRGMIK